MKILLYVVMVLLLSSFTLGVAEIISVEGVVRDATTKNPIPLHDVYILIKYPNTAGIEVPTPTATATTDTTGFFSHEFTIGDSKGPNELHHLTITVAPSTDVIVLHPFYPAGGEISPIDYLEVTEIKINNYLNSYFLDGFGALMACQIAYRDNKFSLSGTHDTSYIRAYGNVDQNGNPWFSIGTNPTCEQICDAGTANPADKTCKQLIKFFMPQARSGQASPQWHWSFQYEAVGALRPANQWLGPLLDHSIGNYFYVACCEYNI